MFELPPKIAQATEALLVIALQPADQPTSGKLLSEWIDVPPRFLEQTMQQLVRAGLLKSARGPKGGYTLSRDKGEITLHDVCNALCESQFPAASSFTTVIGREVVLTTYHQVEHRLMDILGTITLSDMSEMVKSRHLGDKVFVPATFS